MNHPRTRSTGTDAPAGPWLWAPVLVVLLAATAALVLAHVAWERGLLADERFALWYDHSYGEVLAYGMAATAAVLLLRTWIARQQPVDLAWCLTFVLVGLDDGLQLHERAGAWSVDVLHLEGVAGLRGQDLGELGAWALMGVAVLAALSAAHRSSSLDARRDSRRLVVVGALLVATSVLADMGGQVVGASWAERYLAFADDGGELAVLSALVATAAATARRALALSER